MVVVQGLERATCHAIRVRLITDNNAACLDPHELHFSLSFAALGEFRSGHADMVLYNFYSIVSMLIYC